MSSDASSTIVDAYNALAPLYSDYSSKRQNYLSAIDRLVINNLRSHDRLLDVGCGDGRRLYQLTNRLGLHDAVAIEPSTEMAKLCRKKLAIPVYECDAENINSLDLTPFDSAIALWNIFGHIETVEKRVRALKNIAAKLKPEGKLMLDVNNRHNASAYGTLRVMTRLLIDMVDFRESRGDANYEWKIGTQSFPAHGHLFTAGEIESLFNQAGFTVEKRLSVDYETSVVSRSRLRGQLFYVLIRQ